MHACNTNNNRVVLFEQPNETIYVTIFFPLFLLVNNNEERKKEERE